MDVLAERDGTNDIDSSSAPTFSPLQEDIAAPSPEDIRPELMRRLRDAIEDLKNEHLVAAGT